jgi:hypothetical protein
LGKQQINAERCILVVEVAFQLCDLLSKHVWSVSDLYSWSTLTLVIADAVSYTTDDTESSRVGNGCGKLWTSCNVHTSQHYWVLDLEEVGDRSLDLLWGGHLEERSRIGGCGR